MPLSSITRTCLAVIRRPASTMVLPLGPTISKLATSPRKRSAIKLTATSSPLIEIVLVSKKVSRISSLEYSKARRMIDAGSLRRRSIRTKTASLGSNSKSNHEPRYGITRALYRSLPELWVLPLSWSKKTPGDRCSCETTTRSVPLMTNVPLSVMSGISPM